MASVCRDAPSGIRRAIACTLLLLFSPLSHAAAGPGDHPDRRHPYVRAFTGVGLTRPSDLTIRQPGLGTDLVFERVAWEHKSLSTNWDRDSIPYVGVRGGFFFSRPRWLSLSGEVLHFKVFANADESVPVSGFHNGGAVDTVAPMRWFVRQYQVSNGVNMALVNLVAHRALASRRGADGRTDLYAGGGVGITFPFTRSTIGEQTQGQYEWGRLATQLLAGVAWHLSPRWDVFSEYKYTATTVDGAVPNGDSESRLHTQHVAFGLGFHLGRRLAVGP